MVQSNSVVQIELSQPYQINGQPARYQTVWFLARLYYAARWGNGIVSAAELQAHFTANKTIRMLISRAFSDFENWHIVVGWGNNQTTSPASLNLIGRSRGPFWLCSTMTSLLHFSVDGQIIGQAQLANWLGIKVQDDRAAHNNKPHNSVGYLMQDISFWQHITMAMRDEHDGFSKQHNRQVATSFHLARNYAHNDFQHALALMKESLAWRRNAQLNESHATLSKLDKLTNSGNLVTARPTFSAMAYIVRAWRHYVRGHIETANKVLNRLTSVTDLSLVIHYNPKIRFEYLNLHALLQKYKAVSTPKASIDTRIHAAHHALQTLIDALEAAYEADAIDAVQHVTANIGWCLWLFWQHRLFDDLPYHDISSVQHQAIRWLGLSEWICDRFSVANSSAWNIIFLLRIVRGQCSTLYRCTLAQFRQHTPLSIIETRKVLQPFHTAFSQAKGFSSWSTAALFVLEEVDCEQIPGTPLQTANLLLEAIWFFVLEKGITAQAYQLMSRLTAQLRLLPRSEQKFFNEQLSTMPIELHLSK